ncbi:MAG: carbon-nitrogen hydrolase family protein [Armatimonadetes bacterium]|nr:carbon-nitrogen hydrolase family protein [Armatimonadota bacterium]
MSLSPLRVLPLLLSPTVFVAPSLADERVVHLSFDGLSASYSLPKTYGDDPEVLVNAVEPEAGREGPGMHLRLRYGPETPARLSYYHVNLSPPIPILPELREASVWVRSNVPISIKVAISPFGFIYHGPGVGASQQWQQLRLPNLHEELRNWCEVGHRRAEEAFITSLIVAVTTAPETTADITLDDVVVTAEEGTSARLADEARRRRFARVRASVVTLPLSDEGRSLPYVLDRLDEAGTQGSDIVCLPMECIQTDGETIPGPLSETLAAKAKQYGMYVIGNLRERDGDKTYVTSFLLDRQGALVGKYRKSHKLPDETLDLGDELPVFQTDFAKIGMKIGSDRYFPEIDWAYTAQGATMIFWSQEREPVEDEYLQDFPQQGRAQDFSTFIACSRYSRAEEGWITSFMPTYRGSPIGRSYIINREGMPIAYTERKGSVATALIPHSALLGAGRGPSTLPGAKCLVEPVQPLAPRQWAKRKVRLTAIPAMGFDALLQALDEAGRLGTDIASTYEMVWISGGPQEQVQRQTAAAKENLRRIAEKAKQYGMYVLVGGVVDRLERNEAILYGRDGQEVGRYFKIVQTHPEQICGTETPILETDFGRVAVRICADNWMVELDRAYGVKGADIMFDLTQDWGPDAIHRNLRNISRCMDNLFFRVEDTHTSSEALHRSTIVDPCGVAVAQSDYLGSGIVSAVVDLDLNRPRRYSRQWQPHEPGGYLPEYQDTQMPTETNDLREVLLAARRPELYGVIWKAAQ